MKTTLILIVFNLLIINLIQSQNENIPFDSGKWEKKNAQQTEFLGRKCLMGVASLKDVEFQNGIIEFDLAVNGERSYPGIIFRAKGQDEYERVYIRPHLPKTFQNVVQYEGTFNGLDSWQLYYGAGKTTSAMIPVNTWFHVKLEVKDSQARIYLNEMSEPVLTITELAHGLSKGSLGVWGPMDGTAFFSNFSFTRSDNLEFPNPPFTEKLFGILENWQISEPQKSSNFDIEKLPEAQGLKEMKWQTVKSLPSGLIDISRYYGRQGQSPDVIWAKTEIISDKEQTKQFAFGYSDYISIFLNGKLLFTGNSAYTSRDANFQGIIGLNDNIILPLIKGKNELVIAVAEVFGGWGFIFQDVDAVYEHKNLSKQWELRNKFKYPESVVYDKKRDVLYVSNFTYERDGFVTAVKMDGSIVKTDWLTGILQPTGMCIFNDKLFVVGRYALVEIDIEKKSIINRYKFPEPQFANDVTCDENVNLYISDGAKASIYELENGEITEWLHHESLAGANGILLDKNILYLGTSGDGSLKSIDLKTKEIKTIFGFGIPVIMDGLKKDEKGNFLISDNSGRLFRIAIDGKSELLINTKSRQIPIADFEYIPEKKIIVIPSLDDNRVMMYKFTNKP